MASGPHPVSRSPPPRAASMLHRTPCLYHDLLGCGVPGLFDGQFRQMLIFILLDQDANYFHQ